MTYLHICSKQFLFFVFPRTAANCLRDRRLRVTPCNTRTIWI